MSHSDDISTAFTIRPATIADIHVIARHRAEMFTDMGTLPRMLYDALIEETARYLETAIASGEYLGWLASSTAAPQEIVAGAGVQRRRVLPHPLQREADVALAAGHQAIVLNVFTEPAWRRQGLARVMMGHVLTWARSAGLDSLVLHASADGRSLYEELGFLPTNEMRYSKELKPD